MTFTSPNLQPGAAVSPAPAEKIRVMLVDDSAVVRGLVSRMLAEEPTVEVVASCGNGQIAVQKIASADVDVVVLDIEMPVMDGLTALPKLLEINPSCKIIISSTLSSKNAQISLTALELGAADYVTKPGTSGINSSVDFKRELLAKVKSLGARSRKERSRTRREPTSAQKAALAPIRRAVPPAPISLRPAGVLKPQILAIGSSTGGPQALFSFFKALPRQIGVPVVVTQHMPPTFTTILADHIRRASNWPCNEARDGDSLQAGNIYIAPGDHHLLVESRREQHVIRLTKDAPENFCRPAVDPMLRSLVKAYGGRVLVAILTGMGSDGLRGGREVVAAGGTMIAQDEATSVVWGMPGAVAGAGLCAAVMAVPELAAYAAKAFLGAQR